MNYPSSQASWFTDLRRGNNLERMKLRPVDILLLNEAIRPFHDSYHGTALVLDALFMVLSEVEDFIKPKGFSGPIHANESHGPWQEQLSKLRDHQSHSYRDPESLQAAQVLSKMDPIRLYRELETHVCRGKTGASVGNANETLYNKGEWYIKVACVRRAR
jgi:hypothetical protein